MPFTPVARVVGAHGLKGYLKLELLTEYPERLSDGERLRMDGEWITVRATTFHQGRLLIQLEGFRDRTKAESLHGKTLEAQEIKPELARDEFMVRDLIGCRVATTAGQDLGKIDDVLPYPAQDVLAVGSTLIPFVKEFVKDIDLTARLVTVALIPGMVNEAEAVE